MRGMLVFLLSLAFISPAWADLFCPQGFNLINLGDSLDSVLQACGKPDTLTTTKKKPQQPQEWVYYIASYPGMQGTLKTTIAFNAEGKVINISVNGAGESQTNICGATNTIRFGDTQKMITTACGKPSYINESLPQNGAPKEIEVTELRYEGSPAVTLTFEDGKLTARTP